MHTVIDPIYQFGYYRTNLTKVSVVGFVTVGTVYCNLSYVPSGYTVMGATCTAAGTVYTAVGTTCTEGGTVL